MSNRFWLPWYRSRITGRQAWRTHSGDRGHLSRINICGIAAEPATVRGCYASVISLPFASWPSDANPANAKATTTTVKASTTE